MKTDWDVVVVGSGAAGQLAAARLADKGYRTVVIEKAHQYGGTSATSGGALWIPDHDLGDLEDSEEDAMTYLRQITLEEADEQRLKVYVENAKRMLAYLIETGVPCDVFPGFPDYYPDASGAVEGRAVNPREMDGKSLGSDYFLMREPFTAFRLFNRYSLDLAQSFSLSAQSRGWRWVATKLIMRYWLDMGWRLKTRRDRRATMGNALIGGLRRALQKREVPVVLNTRLRKIRSDGHRAIGLEVDCNGANHYLTAKKAIILACGGFEQSQRFRDEFLEVSTNAKWSLTPSGANTGDALDATVDLGAATEFMEYAWWAPSMQLPSEFMANSDITHQMFFDHRHPHSVVVNRQGDRFVNECCAYDDFGKAMIRDQLETSSNIPCWMIFDATYRKKYTCGGLMPSSIMPDGRIPQHWWDNYLYRSDTVTDLAGKIGVPVGALERTVSLMNEYARTGKDTQFHRGNNAYDQFFGDQNVRPNPCIGSIEAPPYYAIRIDLGDLGSKGGLKVDANARVIDTAGDAIDGLYAIGNCSASPFANCYPGAGGTIGAAMTFALVAADHVSVNR